MKRRLKITLIILGILVLITFILWAIYYSKKKNSTISTATGVIVKVNEKSLDVMGIENATGLFNVGYTSEGDIGFKQGQEILIYFNGMVLESYPAQLGKVGKIKIVKEESNISIPDEVLRFYYSSSSNVNVTVSELTSKGIQFNITDTNELPYSYSNSYTIYKRVKNEEYTGIGYKIGENTENSTSGYTRNRS